MELAVLFGTFLILLVIGVPVAFCLGLSALATLLYLDVPMIVAFQRMAAGIDVFALLAIPFFIYAGELMNQSGIAERLVRLAESALGRLKGGLGHVSVLACMMFGAVSGSAVAKSSHVVAESSSTAPTPAPSQSITTGPSSVRSTFPGCRSPWMNDSRRPSVDGRPLSPIGIAASCWWSSARMRPTRAACHGRFERIVKRSVPWTRSIVMSEPTTEYTSGTGKPCDRTARITAGSANGIGPDRRRRTTRSGLDW